MSNNSYIVDSLIDKQSLELSAEEFEARVVEPMVARLRKEWQRWDEPFVQAHLRMTISPIDQRAWELLTDMSDEI